MTFNVVDAAAFIAACNKNPLILIDGFFGRFRWLSNFDVVASILYEGRVYPSAENAYQAAKDLDDSVREKFMTVTPVQAKKLGGPKARGGITTLRSDWETVKDRVMLDILRSKYKHPNLRDKLKATGSATLVEGNWWHDNYWGDCRCGRPACSTPGVNKLGTLTMKVRGEL